MLSENPQDGRESWQIFHPWKILAIPPFSCQATSIITSLAPILEFQYIYDACGVLETTDKATTRTPEQSSRRTAKLSNVSCLENNLVLLGVVHYFKEWVSWLSTRGRGETKIASQISSPDICLLEDIWWWSYNQMFFQHDLIQVGLWRIGKVLPLRDMKMMTK